MQINVEDFELQSLDKYLKKALEEPIEHLLF